MYGATNHGAATTAVVIYTYCYGWSEAAPPKHRKERRAARSKQRRQK